jgi:hypothetical protein
MLILFVSPFTGLAINMSDEIGHRASGKRQGPTLKPGLVFAQRLPSAVLTSPVEVSMRESRPAPASTTVMSRLLPTLPWRRNRTDLHHQAQII